MVLLKLRMEWSCTNTKGRMESLNYVNMGHARERIRQNQNHYKTLGHNNSLQSWKIKLRMDSFDEIVVSHAGENKTLSSKRLLKYFRCFAKYQELVVLINNHPHNMYIVFLASPYLAAISDSSHSK